MAIRKQKLEDLREQKQFLRVLLKKSKKDVAAQLQKNKASTKWRSFEIAKEEILKLCLKLATEEPKSTCLGCISQSSEDYTECIAQILSSNLLQNFFSFCENKIQVMPDKKMKPSTFIRELFKFFSDYTRCSSEFTSINSSSTNECETLASRPLKTFKSTKLETNHSDTTQSDTNIKTIRRFKRRPRREKTDMNLSLATKFSKMLMDETVNEISYMGDQQSAMQDLAMNAHKVEMHYLSESTEDTKMCKTYQLANSTVDYYSEVLKTQDPKPIIKTSVPSPRGLRIKLSGDTNGKRLKKRVNFHPDLLKIDSQTSETSIIVPRKIVDGHQKKPQLINVTQDRVTAHKKGQIVLAQKERIDRERAASIQEQQRSKEERSCALKECLSIQRIKQTEKVKEIRRVRIETAKAKRRALEEQKILNLLANLA